MKFLRNERWSKYCIKINVLGNGYMEYASLDQPAEREEYRHNKVPEHLQYIHVSYHKHNTCPEYASSPVLP